MFKNIYKKIANVKKEIILSILSVITLFSLGVEYRSPFFYCFWVSQAILIFAYFCNLFQQKKIDFKLILTFIIINLWTIYNFTISNFAYDYIRHLKAGLLTVIYSVSAILYIWFLEKIDVNKKRYLKYLNIFWISTNLFIAVLWRLGIYKNSSSFSGLYINRNEFAVTTVVLLALYIYYRKENLIKSDFYIVFLNIFLILISSSFKGFLAVIFIFFYYILFVSKRMLKPKMINIGILLIVIFCSSLFTSGEIDKRVSNYFNYIYGKIIESKSIPENVKPISEINNKDNSSNDDDKNQPDNTTVVTPIKPKEEVKVVASLSSAEARMGILNQSLVVAKNYFFTGVGIDNSRFFIFQPRVDGQKLRGVYTHINYMEILIGGGIIAFLLYYIPFIFFALLLVFRSKKINNFHFLFVTLSLILFFDMSMVTYKFFPILILKSFFYYVVIEQIFRYNSTKNISDQTVTQ
jgi:hypothetical protein